MRHDASTGFENARTLSAGLYDRLERSIIALQYALADARRPNDPTRDEVSAHARAQEALLSAGEEIQQILNVLKNATLVEAGERARNLD